MMPMVMKQTATKKALRLDNGFGRAPPFKGNTDSAISAFLGVDSGSVKGQTIEFSSLLIDEDSPFRASINAKAALETSLGNFISHVQLLQV
jgi:hypothetical protein